MLGQLIQNLVAIVLIDIVADKARWHFERGNGVFKTNRFEGQNPAFKTIRAHTCLECLQDVFPNLHHRIAPFASSCLVVLTTAVTSHRQKTSGRLPRQQHVLRVIIGPNLPSMVMPWIGHPNM